MNKLTSNERDMLIKLIDSYINALQGLINLKDDTFLCDRYSDEIVKLTHIRNKFVKESQK